MNKWIAEFDLEDGDTMPEHMELAYKGARIDFHCKPLEQESKLDNIKDYIDHIRNTGMGKKKSLEFIEKFIEGLKAESEEYE